jgi:nickel/cobalt transporter (NicO) family protein
MSPESLPVLCGTAASIAFVHTLVGVDHAVPFVALGKAKAWSLGKALGIAALCGVAHVLASVLLGALGIGLGLALGSIEWIQAVRGDAASWMLIAFGLCYAAWSVRQRGHSHAAGRSAGAWALFVVFALGPCEALIPLLMVPASASHWSWVIAVTAVFGVVTIATMLAMVAVGLLGIQFAFPNSLERHADAFAGMAIATSGILILAIGI